LSNYKYKAFISYSHADEQCAKWLHRRLESYRIPKKLVEREGLASNRLKPVFRDRDELGTSPSLSNAIEEALTDSETLIVICSPAAAKSRWVDAEVETFKKIGRGERIYCLIADGAPDTAFPPALLAETEALAADINHDGKQNAFLKLVAGILQVAFDDLRQREQQARNRQLMLISSLSFTGMVFAVGLASFAMISRQQAIESREEAEAQRLIAERAEQVAVQEAETSSRVSNFLVGLFQVSDPSEARGNSITARELLDIGAAEIQTELAGQPEIQATLNHTIGDVYRSLGLFQPSRQQLELALVTRRQTLGENHPEVATTLLRLGQLERDSGNLDEARELFLEGLAIRQEVLGEDHPELAQALNDLASLEWEIGAYEESRAHYQQALDIREQAFGENHENVAETLRGMAALAWSGGDFGQASELFVRVLGIFQRTLGEDHPLVAQSMSNLAATYYMQDRFEEARTLYEEVIVILDRVLGPEHPELILGLSNLAETLIELGEFELAASYYERAIDVGEAAVGPDYIELGWPLDGLGTLYHRTGDYESARIYFDRALRLRETVYGPDHVDVADTLEGYAEMLEDAGESTEATTLRGRALAIRERASVEAEQ
jgi:tetratricopeptide (TPR) repeat protein